MRPSFAALTLLSLSVLLAACGSPPGGGSTTSSSSTGGGGAGATGGAGGGSGGAGAGGGTGGAAGGTGGAAGGTGGGADWGPCSVNGLSGECLTVSACEAMPDHGATPGYCPGPADIQCCTLGPSVSDNPPIPDGYKLMTQAEVTPDMTAWAVAILQDPAQYPMFSTTTKMFGTLLVLARVEWHPPDFQNMKVHRGVTLYEPI
jgi:hypothetical protein